LILKLKVFNITKPEIEELANMLLLWSCFVIYCSQKLRDIYVIYYGLTLLLHGKFLSVYFSF